jgi:hypothetical protein
MRKAFTFYLYFLLVVFANTESAVEFFEKKGYLKK